MARKWYMRAAGKSAQLKLLFTKLTFSTTPQKSHAASDRAQQFERWTIKSPTYAWRGFDGMYNHVILCNLGTLDIIYATCNS
jgi:hypothetical protein